LRAASVFGIAGRPAGVGVARAVVVAVGASVPVSVQVHYRPHASAGTSRDRLAGRLIAIFVLLLVNGFIAAVALALVRPRRTSLEAMTRGGDPRARLTRRATSDLGRLRGERFAADWRP
jgi:hypothetical protein